MILGGSGTGGPSRTELARVQRPHGLKLAPARDGVIPERPQPRGLERDQRTRRVKARALLVAPAGVRRGPLGVRDLLADLDSRAPLSFCVIADQPHGPRASSRTRRS